MSNTHKTYNAIKAVSLRLLYVFFFLLAGWNLTDSFGKSLKSSMSRESWRRGNVLCNQKHINFASVGQYILFWDPLKKAPVIPTLIAFVASNCQQLRRFPRNLLRMPSCLPREQISLPTWINASGLLCGTLCSCEFAPHWPSDMIKLCRLCMSKSSISLICAENVLWASHNSRQPPMENENPQPAALVCWLMERAPLHMHKVCDRE